MKQRFFLVSLLTSVVFIVIGGLTGCGSNAAGSGAASGGATGSGTASSGSAPPASTVVQHSPIVIPTLVLPNGAHALTLTLADSNRNVALKPGDEVLLALDDSFYDHWTITVSDPTVLTTVAGVALPEHSQALYKASKAGHLTITASAEPKCRKANPPCNIDTKAFKVQITVG
ncbi:MAG: hypothetical protein NVS4B11_10850 [Ktedonobacteraceae bacterium]